MVGGVEFDRSDEEILGTTIQPIESKPEFRPITEFQEDLAERLNRR
jgi:hypothetical protein